MLVFGEGNQMAYLLEKNGAFHLRTYSTVDISTGQPLKLDSNGKAPRTQQSVMLARKDDGQYRSKSSLAVLDLQKAKLERCHGEGVHQGEPDARCQVGRQGPGDGRRVCVLGEGNRTHP